MFVKFFRNYPVSEKFPQKLPNEPGSLKRTTNASHRNSQKTGKDASKASLVALAARGRCKLDPTRIRRLSVKL